MVCERHHRQQPNHHTTVTIITFITDLIITDIFRTIITNIIILGIHC